MIHKNMIQKLPLGIRVISLYVGWITINDTWRIFFRNDSLDGLILAHNNLLWPGYFLSLIAFVSSVLFLYAVIKRKSFGIKAFYVFAVSGIILTYLVAYLGIKDIEFAREAYTMSRTSRGLSTQYVNDAVNTSSMVGTVIIFTIFYPYLAYYLRKKKDFFEGSENKEDENLGSAGEFKDIVLSIGDIKETAKGGLSIIARGKYKDKIIGLCVEVKGGMKNGIKDGVFDKQAFCREGITFRSIGIESSNLINALSELYGEPAGKGFSKDPVLFTSFALEEKELDLKSRSARFKLFFDDDNMRGLYCELFCNINIPEKQLGIAEKDMEYRKNIIKALSL